MRFLPAAVTELFSSTGWLTMRMMPTITYLRLLQRLRLHQGDLSKEMLIMLAEELGVPLFQVGPDSSAIPT